MKQLNHIFQIIEKEKIILEETNINKATGIYFKIPGIPPTIGIEKSIVNDRCKYISVLAEELGHHFTTLGDLTIKSKNYSEKLQKNKKENIAKIWAANFLISDEEFVQALCDCISNRKEICDCFNVTNEILEYKIQSIIVDEKRYKRIKNILIKKDIPYEACAI